MSPSPARYRHHTEHMRTVCVSAAIFCLAAVVFTTPTHAQDDRRQLRPDEVIPPFVAGIKFPNTFATQWWRLAREQGTRPFIECEPVSKTCDRGVIDKKKQCFIGAVVPDNDRNHVVRNIAWCDYRPGGDTIVTDFGTGRIYSTGKDRPVAHFGRDLPAECVELARTTNYYGSPKFMRGGECDWHMIVVSGEP